MPDSPTAAVPALNHPESTVIAHLRDRIVSGALKPGERVPSERSLGDTLGVKRGYVRKALATLNHFGLIETQPQKGTIVAGFSSKAISGLLASIGNFDERFDPADLYEVRLAIESLSARQAALRAGKGEIEAILGWHSAFKAKVDKGIRALEEDHLFHLAIARASGNAVCFSLLSYITPQILALAVGSEVSTADRLQRTWEEHDRIVGAILGGDPSRAETAMRFHMEEAWKRRSPEPAPGRA